MFIFLLTVPTILQEIKALHALDLKAKDMQVAHDIFLQIPVSRKHSSQLSGE